MRLWDVQADLRLCLFACNIIRFSQAMATASGASNVGYENPCELCILGTFS